MPDTNVKLPSFLPSRSNGIVPRHDMNRDSAEHFCVFVAAAASVALQIMRNTRHFISFFVAPSEEIKYGRGAEVSSFLVDPLCCDRKWIPRTDLTELRDEFESGEGGRAM